MSIEMLIMYGIMAVIALVIYIVDSELDYRRKMQYIKDIGLYKHLYPDE